MKIFTEEYKTVDADAMLDFFKKLEKQTEARIIVHYLPPYSPNLNPIERLWKILKEKTV
ncbi:hypothetical protein RHOW815_000682 [Candidatus Rhabdochlamydia sp. W815]|nr:hypothetical protein RHOW815_000682 [Candidatus Rhabdochlamydia sp. W815]